MKLEELLQGLTTEQRTAVRKQFSLSSQHALAVQTAPFTVEEQAQYGYSLAAAQSNVQVGYFIVADGMYASAEVSEGFQPAIKATASVTKAVEYFTALACYVFGNDDNDEMIEQQAKIRSLGRSHGSNNPFCEDELDTTLRSKGLTADPALLETALQGYAHAMNTMILDEEKRNLAEQLTKKPQQLQSQPIPKRGLRLAAGLLVGDRLSYLTVGDAGIYVLTDKGPLVMSESGRHLEQYMLNYLGRHQGIAPEIKTVSLQEGCVYFSCNRMLRDVMSENMDIHLLREATPATLAEKTKQWHQQLVTRAENPQYKKICLSTFMVK